MSIFVKVIIWKTNKLFVQLGIDYYIHSTDLIERAFHLSQISFAVSNCDEVNPARMLTMKLVESLKRNVCMSPSIWKYRQRQHNLKMQHYYMCITLISNRLLLIISELISSLVRFFLYIVWKFLGRRDKIKRNYLELAAGFSQLSPVLRKWPSVCIGKER